MNGIFEGRFNVIATNPPFGAVVQATNVVLQSDYTSPQEAVARYRGEYGEAYDEAVARVEAAEGKPILSLFKLPLRGRANSGDDREKPAEQRKRAEDKRLQSLSLEPPNHRTGKHKFARTAQPAVSASTAESAREDGLRNHYYAREDRGGAGCGGGIGGANSARS